MPTPFNSTSIADIIDRVAADPAKAGEAKRALAKLVGMHEPRETFDHRPRRRMAEIDDDLFDNMPV